MRRWEWNPEKGIAVFLAVAVCGRVNRLYTCRPRVRFCLWGTQLPNLQIGNFVRGTEGKGQGFVSLGAGIEGILARVSKIVEEEEVVAVQVGTIYSLSTQS